MSRQTASRLAALGLALAGLTAGCRRSDDPGSSPEEHRITLPSLASAIEEGPGKEEYADACLGCHSARYVSHQPRFPREVWTAEVNKMRRAYGASLSDEQAARVVDYLVASHGATP